MVVTEGHTDNTEGRCKKTTLTSSTTPPPIFLLNVFFYCKEALLSPYSGRAVDFFWQLPTKQRQK